MKKNNLSIVSVLITSMLLVGCASENTVEVNKEYSSNIEDTMIMEENEVNEGTADTEGVVSIALADEGITVDGEVISTDVNSAVHIGADIIYYEEGKDELYGEGDKDDAHSKEEADKHTVVTIAKPGTYKVSGILSFGQIAVDLGEEAEDDAAAVVNLMLDGVDINCDVAPGIVVLNAYECGDDSEENATPIVNTTSAGFNLILAKDSENVVNGAYVAKIYKDGTTKEDIEKDEAKKKYKFDAAIDSQVSFNINAQENGKLIINADNEGISSALHMTINGGEIVINSGDDAINTSEDNVSVLTINGGIVTCDSGLGDEGDGIDSNGYITMNDGYVIACANAKSQDSGIDSDKGIFVNGGTLLASGNMYDEISGDSTQLFMVLGFRDKVQENELVMVTDEEDKPIIAFSAVNDYTIAAYSSPNLTEGTYHLYKVSSVTGDLKGSIYTNITDYKEKQQLSYSSNFVGGFGGNMMPGPMEFPFDGELPAMPDGERPEMPEMSEMPAWKEGGERPDMPAWKEEEMPGRGNKDGSTEFTVNKENYQFGHISTKTDS